MPDDIHGMHVAQGILTATGGMTSHAAVVGRQMGKPSIVGAGTLQISETGKQFTRRRKGRERRGVRLVRRPEGRDEARADGVPRRARFCRSSTASSTAKKSDIYQRFDKLLEWADKFRRLGIRANADLPDQAELAYAFGARGIGLCRTEHMFFGEDRLPIVQRMILADNVADRKKAVLELLPMQRSDFYGVFKAMKGSPVTIRTIDPPLHEFLPKREDLMVESPSSKWATATRRSSKRRRSCWRAWSSFFFASSSFLPSRFKLGDVKKHTWAGTREAAVQS